jgi:hypothetical protein
MGESRTHRRKVLWIGPLLVALLVTGCAGIKPYKPRDNREEGMERGLFTGSEGAFVILRKADEPETPSKEKKAEPKSDEQQP